MGPLLLILAAAGAAPQTSSPAPPAYPLAEILSTARAACGSEGLLGSEQDSKRDWEWFTPEQTSWFGRYVTQHTQGGGGLKITSQTYRRDVAGRPLYAFVARMDLSFAPGRPVYTCEIFDPEAPPISLAAVRRWAAKRPKRSGSPSAGSFFVLWEPGLTKGDDETTIMWGSSAPDPILGSSRPGLSYSTVRTSK